MSMKDGLVWVKSKMQLISSPYKPVFLLFRKSFVLLGLPSHLTLIDSIKKQNMYSCKFDLVTPSRSCLRLESNNK